MATYYVSATTGNDSNNGTSVSTPKATIGAGENLATSAGDIVYIAPGTYRETVTHGYSGTQANRIYFIGDPDCEIFTSITPGIVRITTSDTNNIGTATTYCVNSNGKDYITWKNVYLDGGTGGITSFSDNNVTYGFRCASDSDHMEVINCMTQHFYYGTYRVEYMYDSVFMAYYYGTRDGGIADRCVGVAGYCAFYSIDLVRNCVGSGYYCYLYNDKVVNCTAFMGVAGVRTYYGDIAYDNVSLGSYYGFYGGTNTTSTQNGTHSGSLSVMNRYVTYYGKMHGIKVGSSQLQWISGRDPLIGKNGSADMQGDGLTYDLVEQPLYSINNVKKLADVVNPIISSNSLRGSTTTLTDSDAGNVDFFGKPRIMGEKLGIYMEGQSGLITSSRDLGHCELSVVEVTGSYATSSHAFKIQDEGIFRIPITVSASQSVTASIDVKHQKGSGTAVKPQFQLRISETNVSASVTSEATTTSALEYLTGSNLIVQSVNQTIADNTYQTLSVSGSFSENTELELLFINQQTGSDSISSFSDLEIT